MEERDTLLFGAESKEKTYYNIKNEAASGEDCPVGVDDIHLRKLRKQLINSIRDTFIGFCLYDQFSLFALLSF